MSIATQITALSNDRDAIRQAILTKGGTCPSGNGFDDFATDIATIPSGGQTFAMVLVNYPQNSTLTATNVDGYRDIFDSTSANPQRLYYVSEPSGETQTCVFEITDGTQTESKTVSGITVGSSQNIVLDFVYYLYKNGAETVSFAQGIHVGSGASFSKQSNYIQFTANKSAGAGLAYYCETPLVDLTNYSLLKMEVENYSSSTTTGNIFGVFSNNSTTSWDTYASSRIAMCDEPINNIFTIDVSSINTSRYIGFGLGSYASSSVTASYRVKAIWLE